MSQAKSHELTFCADAKAWMEQELAVRPELVFGARFGQPLGEFFLRVLEAVLEIIPSSPS